MDARRFRQVAEIFEAARQRDPAERAALLDSACGSDAGLREQVCALLAKHDSKAGLLKIANTDGAAFFGEIKSAMRDETQIPPKETRRPVGPQRIGHYHIKRIIASGGMGMVYEAVQESPRRVVALKVMRAGIASKSALRRFEYESQILARLRHPNIAQVYEAGIAEVFHSSPTFNGGQVSAETSAVEQDGQTHHGGRVPYFAMEYLPNAKSITEYAKQLKLGTKDRLRLFIQVTEAVHHGHQKGIIHRDLKPGNILVTPTVSNGGENGSQGDVKIIDFGVARATDSDMALTTMQTDVGQLLGTLQYMSPEQCAADPHNLDVRSDIYALGVVMYELMCERLPYDLSSTTMLEAARIIIEQAPARPSSFSRALRGDVETITLKALEKDRLRRYQSAEELGHDIRRYLEGAPISARAPSVLYDLRKWVRKHRVAVAVVALFAVSLAMSLYFNRQWREADLLALERQAQADASWAILAAASDPESSIDRLREIVTAFPQLLKERLFLAHLLYRQGRTKESAEEAHAILRDHPGAGEAHLLLADYYGISSPDLAKQHRSKGRRLLPDDDFWRALAMEPEDSAQAIELLSRELEKDGSNFEARWELAWRHQELGEYEEMLKHTQLLIQTHGNLPLVWNAHGIAQQGSARSLGEPGDRNARLEEAVRSLDSAIKLQPKAARFYANRASALMNLGRLQDALRDCDAALELNPKLDGAYLARAKTLLLLGQLDAAEESLDMAMALPPENPKEAEVQKSIRAERHFRSGIRRSMAGDFPGALDDFDQAVTLEPAVGLYYFSRGRMKRFLHHWAESLADHDAAIERAPTKCYLHHSRAISSRCLGDDDAALADLARWLACSKEQPAPIRLAEWEIQALRGRAEEAQDALALARKKAEGPWVPALARFAAGETTPDELRSAASNKSESLEAEYFIGVKALLAGRPQVALERFRECVDALYLDDLTYDLAKYHLDRLNKE